MRVRPFLGFRRTRSCASTPPQGASDAAHRLCVCSSDPWTTNPRWEEGYSMNAFCSMEQSFVFLDLNPTKGRLHYVQRIGSDRNRIVAFFPYLFRTALPASLFLVIVYQITDYMHPYFQTFSMPVTSCINAQAHISRPLCILEQRWRQNFLFFFGWIPSVMHQARLRSLRSSRGQKV